MTHGQKAQLLVGAINELIAFLKAKGTERKDEKANPHILTKEEWEEFRNLEMKLIGYYLAAKGLIKPFTIELEFGPRYTLTGIEKLNHPDGLGSALRLWTADGWYRQMTLVRGVAQALADAESPSHLDNPPVQPTKPRRHRPMPNEPDYEKMYDLIYDGKLSLKQAALQVSRGDKKRAASLERGFPNYEQKRNGSETEA